MSKTQTDLTEFDRDDDVAEDDETVTKPPWTPMDEQESDCGKWGRCDQCDSRISMDFKRVFGNNDDVLEDGCRYCAEYRQYTGNTGMTSGAGLGGQ